jgi:hypothetical protein
MRATVTVSAGSSRGNAGWELAKNVTTTEAMLVGSVDTTSKYHQSKTEPLMGDTLGASRPMIEDLNCTELETF